MSEAVNNKVRPDADDHLGTTTCLNYTANNVIFVRSRALTIYTIHPGGNFRCKYSVLQLFQMQYGKIRKCISIKWKVQKEKKKCID